MSKYDRIERKIIEGSGNLTFEEITSLLRKTKLSYQIKQIKRKLEDEGLL